MTNKTFISKIHKQAVELNVYIYIYIYTHIYYIYNVYIVYMYINGQRHYREQYGGSFKN